MAIENKITTLRVSQNAITDEDIQTHLEEQNTLGYNLIAVDNLVGWYRFFWEKVVE